jgi:hypothetical protein
LAPDVYALACAQGRQPRRRIQSTFYHFNHKKIFKLKILKTMKKIKLFALAVMAMLGTNAMAADFVNGQFVYEYTTPLSLVSPYSVDVKLKGVNGGATSLTGAVTIPGTFTQTLEGRSYNCTVTEVEANALKGAKITAVTIAPEIKVIGANAFRKYRVCSARRERSSHHD